jgi:hypothetical protein
MVDVSERGIIIGDYFSALSALFAVCSNHASTSTKTKAIIITVVFQYNCCNYVYFFLRSCLWTSARSGHAKFCIGLESVPMLEVLTFSLGKKYYCLLIYCKSLDFVLQLQSQKVMQIKAAFYFMTG